MNEWMFICKYQDSTNTKYIYLELLVNTVGICRSHVAQSAVFPWPLPTPHEHVS